MSILKFNDGEVFDLSGPLRVEERSDGWYVLGEGRMMAVASRSEGLNLIDIEMSKKIKIIKVWN